MSQPLRAVAANSDITNARLLLEKAARNLSSAVLGKEREVRLCLTALVARGHILIEDIPGVGKTTLAEGLARTFGLSFARVQFTSDLLPADILGAQVFKAADGSFEFRQGPIFHELVLADELNRAPPRTQSALLEAMAQAQVSIDGVTHALPAPFVVVATQNPSDLAGTYPLPDSQLDRFQIRLSLGHPSKEAEAEILRARGSTEPVRQLGAIATPEDLLQLQRRAGEVKVEARVADYIVELGAATRSHPDIERGASTRALLSVTAAAKAHALSEGRDFVTPGDVRAVLVPTLSHRVLLRHSGLGGASRSDAAHVLEELGRKTPEPR